MRSYPVKCFLKDGSEKTVMIKATSDREAISEARIVTASQKAVHYQVTSSARNGRKIVQTVIFDSRTASNA
jgi:hypothetical protein